MGPTNPFDQKSSQFTHYILSSPPSLQSLGYYVRTVLSTFPHQQNFNPNSFLSFSYYSPRSLLYKFFIKNKKAFSFSKAPHTLCFATKISNHTHHHSLTLLTAFLLLFFSQTHNKHLNSLSLSLSLYHSSQLSPLQSFVDFHQWKPTQFSFFSIFL